MPERTINPGATSAAPSTNGPPSVAGAGWVPARPPSFWVASVAGWAWLRPLFPWLLIAVINLVLVLGAAAIIVMFWPQPAPGPGPGPGDFDAAFVPVAERYAPLLSIANGDAWLDGANALESGKPLSESLDLVASKFHDYRVKAYERRITPALSAVVPEPPPDTKPNDIKPLSADERARLVRAFRGMARGFGTGLDRALESR